MFRVWVAGPRCWENSAPLEKLGRRLIANYGIGRLLVMTGGAPGVDKLFEEFCTQQGIHVFRCSACWPVGRHAGPVRNETIAREFEPDVLIALHYYELKGTDHRGTRSAIRIAQKYDIPTKIIRVRPEVAMPSSVADSSPLGNRARTEQGLPARKPKAARSRTKARRTA